MFNREMVSLNLNKEPEEVQEPLETKHLERMNPKQVEQCYEAIAEAENERAHHLTETNYSHLKESFLAGSVRVADIALNKVPIPGLDFGKAAIESAVGKTLSGKVLTAKDRILWASMSSLIMISYAMMFSEKFADVDLSKPGVAVRVVPMLLAVVADWRLVEDYVHKYIDTHPSQKAFLSNILDHIKPPSSELISLNLNDLSHSLEDQLASNAQING